MGVGCGGPGEDLEDLLGYLKRQVIGESGNWMIRCRMVGSPLPFSSLLFSPPPSISPFPLHLLYLFCGILSKTGVPGLWPLGIRPHSRR